MISELDPARIGGEQQHPVAHQHRFLDIVGDQDDALDRQLAVAPQFDQIGAQIFRRQHVQRAEGLVHQKNVGMHHHGAGEADALAHAAGQFARIGAFVTVQADQVDGGQRAGAHFLRRQVQRFQPQLHILQHREPGKQREALEHHRHALGRTFDGRAHIGEIAALRLRQAGDQAQQGGFAGAGAAEQADDLALLQGEIDIVQHQQFLAAAARKGAAHMFDVREGPPSCSSRRPLQVSRNLRSAYQ